MKNHLNTKHILVGVITALLTGSLLLTILQYFGHMPLDAMLPWVLPLVSILAGIGLSVGLVGKRNGNTPLKVCFSTLFGTGVGAFTMILLVGFVVYPIAKLGERLGLIDRSAISTDVASTLVIVAMIVIWLIVGLAVGIMLLSVAIKKQGQTAIQTLTPEHRV